MKDSGSNVCKLFIFIFQDDLPEIEYHVCVEGSKDYMLNCFVVFYIGSENNLVAFFWAAFLIYN